MSSLDRVRMIPATTAASPNEGITSGSLSVEQSGSAVRYAAAQARAIYLGAAAQRLGVAAESLEVEDGTIVGPGNLRTSYWELADDALLARDASPGVTRQGARCAADRGHAGGAARSARQGVRPAALRARSESCPACCMAAC